MEPASSLQPLLLIVWTKSHTFAILARGLSNLPFTSGAYNISSYIFLSAKIEPSLDFSIPVLLKDAEKLADLGKYGNVLRNIDSLVTDSYPERTLLYPSPNLRV